jgi:hypothetical protein
VPVETKGMTLDDRDALATLVHQRVQALLKEHPPVANG